MVGIGVALLAVAFFAIFVNTAYAQTVSEQTTLSGDLENNPAAQEILKKIEKSKRWIENIQKRNADNLERQQALEEKRAEVLKFLEEDLKKWEELWEDYTFEKRFKLALENSTAKDTDLVYDHHLKFTASKIHAGPEALKQVIANGGGPVEARNAYAEAAKITRDEMIAINALFNVHYGYAYYNQQILFEKDGQFDQTLSGEQLRKYYQDYRTNPEYLKANPFDKISWEDLGKNSPATKCRDGYALVYRTHADDYVCTTQSTAEMWVRHEMGTVVGDTFSENKHVDVKQLEKDRISEKIKNLNSRISTIQEHYEKKISETKTKYDLYLVEIKDKRIEEEKQAIAKFDNSESKRKVLSQKITDMREKYILLEENIELEKSRTLKILEEQHMDDLDDFVRNYESDPEIKLEWKSHIPVFYLIN